MDNIEKALDNFFQRLGHTPGPWFLNPGDSENDVFIRATLSEKDGTKENFDIANTGCDETGAVYSNSRLIAQSPAMLRTLCRTYLILLTNIKSLYLPEILVPLRDQISEATGIASHELERTFTQYAIWIELGGRPDTSHTSGTCRSARP